MIAGCLSSQGSEGIHLSLEKSGTLDEKSGTLGMRTANYRKGVNNLIDL